MKKLEIINRNAVVEREEFYLFIDKINSISIQEDNIFVSMNGSCARIYKEGKKIFNKNCNEYILPEPEFNEIRAKLGQIGETL